MERIKINIGKYIKDTVNNSGYSFAEVARKIGISRQKLKGWFQKDDMYVKDICTISEAINIDLLKPFCLSRKENNQQAKENSQPTKVVLHIEVSKEKMNDVLKVIEDKNLYDILKNQ